MALHRDASESRLPSMSTVLCITEPNAVLPAGGFEGLEELIRRGAAGALIAEPAGPLSLFLANAACADLRCSDQDGGTRTVLARAAMSLDLSGDHHAANGRDQE